MDTLRPEPPPMYGRRGLLLIIGALFLLTAFIACWWLIAQREVVLDRERAQLHEFLEEQVDAWEDNLLQHLKQWLVITAAAPENAAWNQKKLRQQQPFFDSMVVWIPPTEQDPRPLFPPKSAPEAALLIKQSPCLRLAERLTLQGVRLDELAAAYLIGCTHEDVNVRLHAASRAANLYASAKEYRRALLALDSVRIPDALSLRNAAAGGIDPVRLATVRAQRIQYLLQLDERTDEALDLAVRTGEQLSGLEAPDLAAVNVHMRVMVSILEENGRSSEAAQLEARFQRAERRKHAHEEVHRKLVYERVDPEAPPEPRLVSDMYSDQPFLLYYGWSNGVGVALALEQEPLLQDFLRNRMQKFPEGITLVNARTDQYVAGARTGGRCAIVVPFDRTLPLKVCMREDTVERIVFAMSDDRWYINLIILVACVIFALGALIAVDKAARHEYELLYRQRAFSTRVTHELKTPLAGIKVMAENIELGAYRDEAHRREMAHRIVVESDQLTRRVDEVLAVARQRTIPKPEPFDPEEILLMLVDEWGPRMADAGMQLHAELGATDPVTGDPRAFRDAVACLLDNALKYRREDGVQPEVWLDLAQLGRTVVVTVTDNGIGVPKAMRKKIFDRFVRVEGPHRGKAGGHGLGLNQVREIVAAHHGTVACGEGRDGGAQFVIRVPATPETARGTKKGGGGGGGPPGRWWRRLRDRWAQRSAGVGGTG